MIHSTPAVTNSSLTAENRLNGGMDMRTANLSVARLASPADGPRRRRWWQDRIGGTLCAAFLAALRYHDVASSRPWLPGHVVMLPIRPCHPRRRVPCLAESPAACGGALAARGRHA